MRRSGQNKLLFFILFLFVGTYAIFGVLAITKNSSKYGIADWIIVLGLMAFLLFIECILFKKFTGKSTEKSTKICLIIACIGTIFVFILEIFPPAVPVYLFLLVGLILIARKNKTKHMENVKKESIAISGNQTNEENVPCISKNTYKEHVLKDSEEIRVTKQDNQKNMQAGNNLIIGDICIPANIANLLWIKGWQNYTDDIQNEPSLIDLELEIDNTGKLDSVDDIGYYPNYKGLNPKQRYIYLNWLQDIKKPIPIGYVFIFYYGLERHLLFGNTESAFDMIVEIRKYHDNSSFNSYSADALFIGALYYRRIDLLSKINLVKATPALAQFVTTSLTGQIDIDNMIDNCKSYGFTNLRYLKNDNESFKAILKNLLIGKYGVPYFPIEEGDLKKCKETFPLVLANYSLKMETRLAKAPDIVSNKQIQSEVLELLNETHEQVKIFRRKNKSIDGGLPKNVLTNEDLKEQLKSYSNEQNEFSYIVGNINYSTIPHENVPMSLEEELFFKALIKAMKENNLWNKEGLRLTRLGSRTFNVECASCHLGKVFLHGENGYMQVFRGMSQIKEHNNVNVGECIQLIPAWIRYIKYCRRN